MAREHDPDDQDEDRAMDLIDDRSGDDDLGGPARPLPPPPGAGELWSVFCQRVALRYPALDATRIVLVIAAVAGLGGMAWMAWSPGGRSTASPPVRVSVSTTTTSIAASTTTAPRELVVDVSGAVVRPGPVRVRPDARVADAIAAAGGAGAGADLERVDRAARLQDGQRVYVPRTGQTDIPSVVGVTGPDGGAGTGSGAAAGSGGASGSTGAPDPGASGPVDINTADATALATLPGVGPATAQAILEYRSAHGPFAKVDDLLDVRGIGPAKMAALRPHVTV